MKTLIVGLGLIGASYAQGLSKKGYEVYGVDKDIEVIEFAMKSGYVLDASIYPGDFIPNMDLIILALYPDDILPFIEKYNNLFHEGQIITDVCGIKEAICKSATELARPAFYVGHHPMAGREKIGIKFADSNIFKDGNFLVTPVEGSDYDSIDVVRQIGIDLEFKNVYEVSAKYHDKMIAYTSQLTHAIAVSLVNSDSSVDVSKFIGDSYRDLTRIAMINENLWTQLFLDNRENLLMEMDEFIEEIGELRDIIAECDVEKLREKFISSTKKRGSM